MTYRSLVVGGVAVASWVLALNAQTAQPQQQQQPAAQQQQQQQPAQPRQQPAPARATPARTTAATTPAHAGITADDQRAFLKQYCVACHSEAAAGRGVEQVLPVGDTSASHGAAANGKAVARASHGSTAGRRPRGTA